MSIEGEVLDPIMNVPPEIVDTIDLAVQEVLLAASNHDISSLRASLRKDEQLVSAQDPETGFAPLHAAIAACEEDEPVVTNGHVNTENSIGPGPESANTVDKAKATVQWLLQQGAVWNQLDADGETPGCIAYRLGLRDLYEIMVDAGTRAEMLLSRLEEYAQLADDDEAEDEVDDGDTKDAEAALSAVSISDQPQEVAEDNQSFLKSELTFQPEALLDRDANGVMMSWETDIMKQTVDYIVPLEGLRVLNIGHGMGIIDTIFQAKKPSSHHIIEAHPAVLDQLRQAGWYERPGVKVHEGRWQDIVPELIDAGEQFDAIFYDTFAEDYKAFKALFDEHMIGLLDDAGKWSFFNGLGGDRQISYDVYKNIVSMDLQECGYEVIYHEVDVPDLMSQGTWEATKRPYWTLTKYQLPVCSFFA